MRQKISVNWVVVACAVAAVSWAFAQDKVPAPHDNLPDKPKIKPGDIDPAKQSPIPKQVEMPKPEPAQKSIRAERIELVDKEGRTRFLLATSESGADVQLLNKAGKPMIRLQQLSDAQALLRFDNPGGHTCAYFQIGGDSFEMHAESLNTDNQKSICTFGVYGGSMGFSLRGANQAGIEGRLGDKCNIDLYQIGGANAYRMYTLDNGKWYYIDPGKR